MEHFTLYVVLVLVILMIIVIELYLNMDKHRFRLQMMWKRMQPGLVDWVDNAASIKDRIALCGVEVSELEQEIARYRENPKKFQVQVSAVNAMQRLISSMMAPELARDSVMESLLDSRLDIEQQLAEGVMFFNNGAKVLNDKVDNLLFRPVAKLFRIKKIETLMVGKD